MAKQVAKKYTKQRPSIPAAVSREIRVQARFRCACCNETSGLERAHIDGNRENNDPNNLILLCAICHIRFDNGEISEKEILMCKEKTLSESEEILKLREEIEELKLEREPLKLGVLSADANAIVSNINRAFVDLSGKTIIFLSLMYLVAPLYVDNRSDSIFQSIREVLDIKDSEQEVIIKSLIRNGQIIINEGLYVIQKPQLVREILGSILEENKLNLDIFLEGING